MTDKEVILKIRSGRIDEFAYFVRAYSGKILKYVKNRLKDRDEAEDLVQNTFLKFYRAIGHFEIEKPVLPYLYAIAKNELRMYWRSHKITLTLEENLIQADFIENDFEANEAVELIKQLPPHHQQVLKLVSDGYSYEEIARTISKPVNTVRTWIRRGRLKLRKIYEKKA